MSISEKIRDYLDNYVSFDDAIESAVSSVLDDMDLTEMVAESLREHVESAIRDEIDDAISEFISDNL